MKKVLSKIFWILVIILMAIATFDFYRVRNGNKPLFCLKKDTFKYDDGETDICIGPIYKVYEYRRTELKGIEFVSIFSKEKMPPTKEVESIEE